MTQHGPLLDPESPALEGCRPCSGSRRILWLLLLASLALIVVVRLLGPSALQRFDQPKTVAYTASMVIHHQWLLPDDMMGRLATKPPLVNWLAAPLVALGFWTEWAVKLPMLLASIGTLFVIVVMGRYLLARCPETAPWATEGGILAGLAWLTTPATAEAIYHCRPDPLLVAFLAGAWALATIAMNSSSRPSRWVTVGLWGCVGLAGLTKGPPALLSILFVPLMARCVSGAGSARRTGWKWGIPLALALIGVWLIPVAILHAHHFFHVLLGQEMFSRIAGVGGRFGNVEKGGGTLSLMTGIYRNPVWLIQKMLPWSLAALATLWLVRPRQWFRHPLAPAILWVFLVLGFFSLTAGKTADYILPAYPAIAILSAYFCITAVVRWNLRPVLFGVIGLLLAIGLSVQAIRFSTAARERLGENTQDFARKVELATGADEIAFVETGYNTLQFFLRRHQPGAPSPEVLQTAPWIIQPVSRDLKAEVTSDKLPGIGDGGKPGRLGLYRADDRVRAEARERLGLKP